MNKKETKKENTKSVNAVDEVFKKKYKFSTIVKDALKSSYKSLIFIAILFLILTYPVPYYVFTSGGITDLSERFEIEGDSFQQKGSYNLSYVLQRNGNVLTYVLSHFINDWELVEKEKYQISSDESFEEMLIRDKLSLTQANQTALYVAYSKAGKEPVINDTSYYVAATYDVLTSSEKIKIGDKLLKIEDILVKDFEDVSNVIDSKSDGDYVKLTLERDGKEIETKVRINESNDVKIIGIMFYRILNLDVNPNIKFLFSDSESGSSAGLMTTLAIYDALIEEDLTHGLKIAGTGTISIDGTVGEIGGVRYKVAGAENGGASIFLVPSGENYEEAIKVKKERNYKIEIVEIKTFDDAVNYLRNLN